MKPRSTFKATLQSSWLSLACLAGLSFGGGYWTVGSMQADLARFEAHWLAGYVRREFQERASEEVWKDLSGRPARGVFEGLAEAVGRIGKVQRIKVWDASGRLVWSDGEKAIGTRSADEGLRRALAGTVRYEFQSPGHGPLEREAFRRSPVLETYVPVRRAGGGGARRADLVVEVYADARDFFARLKSVRNQVWTTAGVGGLAVSLVVLGAVRWSGRRSAKEAGRSAALSFERDRLADRLAALHRELASSEERYRALTETATDAVVTADAEGRIVLFNAAAERMFGYSAEEALGTPVAGLVPESGREEHGVRLRRFRESWDSAFFSRSHILEGLRKDGTVFPVEVSVSAAGRGRLQFTGICRDITARVCAEEALRNAQVRALRSEKLASIGTLVAGVAHEILNPVNNLSLYLQLLQTEFGGGLSGALRETFDVMRAQVDRVSRITKNLLQFARPREGEPRPLDIRRLLDQVVDLVEYQYRVSNVELVRDYARDLPRVEGDEDQLTQVFLNLIGNARDAMPEGGRIALRVRPFTREGAPWVRVAVEDKGAGIPQENLNRIFDPFFTTKPEGKGTGLGLSISHRIVEDHEGRIDVKSAVGEGTTFWVELPAAGEERNG